MDDLTPEQRAAVESDARALEIRAGAGTGKTHTLVHRVARLAPDARAQSRTLVVTFTREATATLQRRLSLLLGRDHRVHVLSFHQWAARELPRDGLEFFPDGEGRRVVQDLLRRVRPNPGFARALGVSPESGEDLAGRVLQVLSYAKNAETTLGAALCGPFAAVMPWEGLMQEAQSLVDARKGARLDFDDLLAAFRDRLKKNEAFRASVRARWDHVLVDEYQDVNGIQAETVRLVTTGEGAPRVTVVGDARQAIYGFRGGSPSHLDAFLKPYGREGKSLALTVNFRATRTLVAAANRVVADPHPMRARPRAPEGDGARIVACDDELDEASLVADRIERLLADGADPADMVVLCRARSHARAFQDEVLARLNLDRRLDGDAYAASVDAFLAFARAVEERAPLPGLSLATEPGARARAAKARDDATALISLFGDLPWLDPQVRRGAPLLGRRARAARLTKVPTTAAELLALPKAEGLDRVLVSTIHAAKGLEWDHVFLMGAREGGLPIEHALQAPPNAQAELLAEERRLLYVATTRARRTLTISWPQRTGRRTHEPSRFLKPLLDPDAPVAPAVPAKAAPVPIVAPKKRAPARKRA